MFFEKPREEVSLVRNCKIFLLQPRLALTEIFKTDDYPSKIDPKGLISNAIFVFFRSTTAHQGDTRYRRDNAIRFDLFAMIAWRFARLSVALVAPTAGWFTD